MSAFIAAYRDRFGVEPICRILGVSEHACYRRAAGVRSRRRVEDELLLGLIRDLHARNWYAYGSRRVWLACIGVILNWAGDSLDGTVARFRRIERHRYGFFVDRIADLWSKPIIFLGLAFSSLARFDVIAMALVVLLMASAYSLVYSHASREQRITYAGFGPTEIRFLLICANLFTLSFGIADASQWIPLRTDLPVITVFDLLAITLSAAAFVTLALLTLRDRRALDREDPIIGAPAFRDPPQDTAPSIPLPSPRNAA